MISTLSPYWNDERADMLIGAQREAAHAAKIKELLA